MMTNISNQEVNNYIANLSNINYVSNLTCLTMAERLYLHEFHSSYSVIELATIPTRRIKCLEEVNTLIANAKMNQPLLDDSKDQLIDQSVIIKSGNNNSCNSSICFSGWKRQSDEFLIQKRLDNLNMINQSYINQGVGAARSKIEASKIIEGLQKKFAINNE